MKDEIKGSDKRQWKRWHKLLLVGLGVFIAMVIALVSMAPENTEHPEIILVSDPRPMAEVRHEIDGAWSQTDYLRKIREHFFKTMQIISKDPKYKDVEVAKLAYRGWTSDDKAITFAMFWVEMKDWRQIDPSLHEYDYTDQAELRQLGYLQRFGTITNKYVSRALRERVREIIKQEQ